jgi:cysteine desulfuration protein SufE
VTDIQIVQDEIVEEFVIFDDWMDRYNYLIELANDLPIIDPKLKNNDYLIRGCQSKVTMKVKFTIQPIAMLLLPRELLPCW